VTGGGPLGSRAFPFGGSELRRMPGRCRHDRCLPSWGYALSRRFNSMPVARHGFRAAPLPPGLADLRFGRSAIRTRRSVPGASGVVPASPSTRLATSGSSSEFAPPSGYRRRARRAPPWRTTRLERARGLPGFFPLQHIRIRAFTHIARVCLTRLRSAYRVSDPPDGFPRSDPSGLVSSRKRSWGSDPSELSSFRGAVAPLDARCPPVVTIADPSRGLDRTPSHARTMVRVCRYARRGCESRDVPASGLCSPRKSVAIRRWFRPPATRCSPGLQPLQGLRLRAWPDG
jgi:hypothetical protein